MSLKLISCLECLNPTPLRKAKIVYNFGLSECNRVKSWLPLRREANWKGQSCFPWHKPICLKIIIIMLSDLIKTVSHGILKECTCGRRLHIFSLKKKRPLRGFEKKCWPVKQAVQVQVHLVAEIFSTTADSIAHNLSLSPIKQLDMTECRKAARHPSIHKGPYRILVGRWNIGFLYVRSCLVFIRCWKCHISLLEQLHE